MHRLSIDRVKIDAALKTCENTKRPLYFGKPRVRNSNSTASPGRSKRLAFEQLLSDAIARNAEPCAGLPGKIADKAGLVCRSHIHQNMVGRKKVFDIHW